MTTGIKVATFIFPDTGSVAFGPTNTEGDILIAAQDLAWNNFMIQIQSEAEETPMEASGIIPYSDGYAMQIKYKIPTNATAGIHAACIVSEAKANMSCWGVTIDGTPAISATSSYLLTSGITGTMDLSGSSPLADPVVAGEPWKAGFLGYWVVTHNEVGTNFEIMGQRFLPKLDETTGKSPAGDLRWSPITTENPDPASDVAVWIYGTAQNWTKYSFGGSAVSATYTLTGATELIVGAASAAVLALLTF